MSYMVEVEYKNYQTGESRTWRKGTTYKTRGRAEKAALSVSGIVRPTGGEKLSETWGRVIEVSK